MYLPAAHRGTPSRRRSDDADSAAAVTFPRCHANTHRSLWPAVALSAAINARVWLPSSAGGDGDSVGRVAGRQRQPTARPTEHSSPPISMIVQCATAELERSSKLEILGNEGEKIHLITQFILLSNTKTVNGIFQL